METVAQASATLHGLNWRDATITVVITGFGVIKDADRMDLTIVETHNLVTILRFPTVSIVHSGLLVIPSCREVHTAVVKFTVNLFEFGLYLFGRVSRGVNVEIGLGLDMGHRLAEETVQDGVAG